MYKIFISLIFLFPSYSFGKNMIFEDFKNNPSERWEFIADTVMGGVSEGRVSFQKEKNIFYARMTGNVSLENNGGFIQFRRKVENKLSNNLQGINVKVRGNDLEYYIHIRTKGTILPWQYYQAAFKVKNEWNEIAIKFLDFKRSGIMLSKKFKPKNITSFAIVAYGKNHKVNIEVDTISLY